MTARTTRPCPRPPSPSAISSRFFSSLEPLRPTGPQRLGQCRQLLEGLTEAEYQDLCRRFEDQFPQWQRHLTNVAEYLLFRHWHKTVNDDQLYGRAAFVSCSMSLLYHLFLTQWAEREALSQTEEISICCTFSREVEHMEENLNLAIDTCAALSPDAIHFPQCYTSALEPPCPRLPVWMLWTACAATFWPCSQTLRPPSRQI